MFRLTLMTNSAALSDQQGYNGTDPLTDPMDDNGHGTHLAWYHSVREGDNSEGYAGINWHVQIMPLKIPSDAAGFGDDGRCYQSDQLRDRSEKHGVNIRVIIRKHGGRRQFKSS
jgi:hypothetical protein